jgi:hypothetical protein
MPFTISHPAASIPLARRGLVLSALVVGSLTPDIPYYIPGFTQKEWGHSLAGIIGFCLPAGLGLIWLFHNFLKAPLILLLPDDHRLRLVSVSQRFDFLPVSRLVLICVSILVGALTHILWDSFTHRYGWVVNTFPVLRAPWIRIHAFSLTIPPYEILQHLSSLLGLFLIAFWYLRWYQRTPLPTVDEGTKLSDKARLRIIVGLSILAGIVAMLSAWYGLTPERSIFYLRALIVRLTVVGLGVYLTGLFTYCALWYRFRR